MAIKEIMDFITNPVFITYIGALCGHILSIYSSEFKGAIPFLEKMFPNKTETFYFRANFILIPVIGSLLAFFLLAPDDIKESLFAGLSWSGTMVAVLKKNTGN
ncbi:MAG: hypothetical protein IPM34_00865 [Saprospiraceae bacterium]|nr:hypothetical protein [Saprospiraceae bacterium]